NSRPDRAIPPGPSQREQKLPPEAPEQVAGRLLSVMLLGDGDASRSPPLVGSTAFGVGFGDGGDVVGPRRDEGRGDHHGGARCFHRRRQNLGGGAAALRERPLPPAGLAAQLPGRSPAVSARLREER